MPVPMFLFLFSLMLVITTAYPKSVGMTVAVIVLVKLWRVF